MGITERKNKEKQELKALILEAARTLFLERGIEETSMRNIADRIEYSPATIYLYFKDKDEILHELHSQGFQELGARMTVLQAVSDPLERLKALGRVYLEFARENSEMYDLMFISKSPMHFIDKMDELHWTEGKRAFDFLLQTVKDCMAAGRFSGHDPEALSFLIWSSVHGMSALEIRGRCKEVTPFCHDTQALFHGGFETLTKILEKI